MWCYPSLWVAFLLAEAISVVGLWFAFLRPLAEYFDWGLLTQVALLVGIIVVSNAYLVFLRLKARQKHQSDVRDAQEEHGTGHSPESGATEPSNYEDLTNDEEPANDDNVDSRRWWLWPLAAIAFQYTLAAVTIGINEPTLPTVHITGEKTTKGALLAHTDGFWYVFDLKGDNEGRLNAIPDEDVDNAQIFHEGKRQERSIISVLWSKVVSTWHSWVPSDSESTAR
jgi:hypothetical protein